MRFALLAILTSCLYAQTGEIQGTVVEAGLGLGVAGAEVILTGFVPANDTLEERRVAAVLTDEKGRFSFKPAIGEYRVDIAKPGYKGSRSNSSREFVILTKDRPTTNIRFELMNPSGIAGRFVDEQDHPVRNLWIMLEPLQGVMSGPPLNISTDAEGAISVENIPPGGYYLRAVPRGLEVSKSIEYSETEANKVDRDFEAAFWPGGALSDRDALPLNVVGGGVTNLGAIRLRQIDYYRVHLRVDGDCSGKGWKLAVISLPQYPNTINFVPRPVDCAKDLLVGGLLPGNYELALSNTEAPFRWATAQVTITNRNAQATLRLNPAVDVAGRFVAAEGSKLPSFTQRGVNVGGPNQVAMNPFPSSLKPGIAGLADGDNRLQIAADGSFFVRDRLWDQYKLSLNVPRTHYVSRIRYGGQPVENGRFTLVPGSELEIELDEHPASLTVNLRVNDQVPTDRFLVALAKTPVVDFEMGEGEPFSYIGNMETPGVVTFQGLAPGEYRVLAIPQDTMVSPIAFRSLGSRVAAGERIVLERGQSRSLDLKLRVP